MFKVYHSNDLELLAELGLRISRAQPLVDANGEIDPFIKECILVQSEGMKTFVYQKWAENTGIAVQLEHNFIWSYLWKLGRMVIKGFPDVNPYDRQTLTLNLIAILTDPANKKKIQEDPDFKPILKFIDLDKSTETSNEAKPEIALSFIDDIRIDAADRIYQLAEKLADIYDQYQVYRMRWINSWDDEKDLEHYDRWLRELKLDPAEYRWQAKLWHEYVRKNYADIPQEELASKEYYASSYRDFDRATALALIVRVLKEKPVGFFKDELPQRIFVYGVTSLAPIVLDIFVALGRHIDVHFMFTNPCQEYWGDLTDSKTNLNKLKERVVQIVEGSAVKSWDGKSGQEQKPYAKLKESDFNEESEIQIGNSLLLSFGKQGRDTLALLVEKTNAAEEFAGEIQAFLPPLSADNNKPRLLDILKQDIFEAKDINNLPKNIKRIISREDNSLIFHSCTSKLREVQVAYDAILNLFVQDPSLRPRDVIVMTPNIGAYAPFIEGVFKTNNSSITALPYSICDRSIAEENPVMDSFMTLLGLNDGVMNSVQIFELFKTEQIRMHFGIEVEDLDTIEKWINDNNIIRGLDQAEIIKENASLKLKPGDYPLTFSDGLKRLLLGSLMPELDSDDYVEYNTNIEGGAVRVLGHFYNFIMELISLRDSLNKERSIGEWQEFIYDNILAKFFSFGDKDIAVRKAISMALLQIESSLKTIKNQPCITLNIVRRTMQAVAVGTGGFSRFLRDTLNFCTFVPMRSIPFKHVFLLGMNDGDFPRNKDYINFDIMANHFELGDRSMRNDDRYMFLEAILAAENSVYISYIGKNPSKGNELNPSILVSELQDYILECCVGEDKHSVPSVEALRQHLFKQERLNPYDDLNFCGDNASFQIQWLEKKYFQNKKPVIENIVDDNGRSLVVENRYENITDNDSGTAAKPKPILAQGLFMLGKLDPGAGNVINISLEDLVKFYSKPSEFFIKNVLGIYENQKDELLTNEGFEINFLKNLAIKDNVLGKKMNLDDYFAKLSAKGYLPLLNLGEAYKNKIKADLKKIKEFNDFLAESCYLESENIDFTITIFDKNDENCEIYKYLQKLRDSEGKEFALYNKPITVRIYGVVNNIFNHRILAIDGYRQNYKLLMPYYIKLLALENQNKKGYSLTAINRAFVIQELNNEAENSVRSFAYLVKAYLLARVKPLPILFRNVKDIKEEKKSKDVKAAEKNNLPPEQINQLAKMYWTDTILKTPTMDMFNPNEYDLALFGSNTDVIERPLAEIAATIIVDFSKRIENANDKKTPNERIEELRKEAK